GSPTARWGPCAAPGAGRAVVLRGAGRSFGAGIAHNPAAPAPFAGPPPAEKVLNYYHRYRGSHRRTQGIEAIPQPIVVALHGHCLGAGLEIAMLADIRLAAEGTVFGCPGVEIGGPIDCVLDLRVGAGVGPACAEWVAVAARRVDAALAHRLGLVQEVHPEDELFTKAHELAAEIASNAPLAVQATKRTIDMFADQGLDGVLRFEAMNAAV